MSTVLVSVLNVVGESLNYFIAGIFIVAASHKLADTKQFNNVLNSYQVLPNKVVGIVSPVIPVVELAVALSLCLTAWFGWFNGVSAAASMILFIAYTGALTKVYLEGRSLEDCGCGGSANQPISLWSLSRNVVLIGLCTSLYLNQGQGFSQMLSSDSVLYSVQVISLAIALSLIYWSLDELQKNRTLILLLEKYYD